MLEGRAKSGKLPKAIVVVDLYGQCADYARIVPLAEKYSVPIIEDAAEALGATHGTTPAGGFGAMSIFSFNGNKIITTGGGGALASRRKEYIDRARFLATLEEFDLATWREVESVNVDGMFLVAQAVDLLVTLIFRKLAQVDDGNSEGSARNDHLHRLAVSVAEPRPQTFMAIDHRLEGGFH